MEPFTNANKPTTIKKFIEHKLDKSIKWLETDTGRKYKCDESIIAKCGLNSAKVETIDEVKLINKLLGLRTSALLLQNLVRRSTSHKFK